MFHTGSEWSKAGLQVQPIMAQAARTAMELDELMREVFDREAFSVDSPFNLFLSCRMPRMILRYQENWTDAGLALGCLVDYSPPRKSKSKHSQSVHFQFAFHTLFGGSRTWHAKACRNHGTWHNITLIRVFQSSHSTRRPRTAEHNRPQPWGTLEKSTLKFIIGSYCKAYHCIFNNIWGPKARLRLPGLSKF